MRFHCPHRPFEWFHTRFFFYLSQWRITRPPQQIIYKHNCSRHLTEKEIGSGREGVWGELTQRHRGQFSQWKANEMRRGFSRLVWFIVLPVVSFMHSLTKQICYCWNIDLTISLTLAKAPTVQVWEYLKRSVVESTVLYRITGIRFLKLACCVSILKAK